MTQPWLEQSRWNWFSYRRFVSCQCSHHSRVLLFVMHSKVFLLFRATLSQGKSPQWEYSVSHWQFDEARYALVCSFDDLLRPGSFWQWLCLTATLLSALLFLGTEALSFRDNSLTGKIPSNIFLLTDLGMTGWRAISCSLERNTRVICTHSLWYRPRRTDLLYLYGNSLTGFFTCPDFIDKCFVSCNRADEECRVL